MLAADSPLLELGTNESANIDAFELLQIKQRRLTLLKQRAQLRQDFGLLYYRPHDKQHRFHCAGNFKRRYTRAGNRYGKSDQGVAEDGAWLLGYRPWYTRSFDIFDGKGNIVSHHPGGEDHELVRKGIPQRPVKGLVIAADWDKVREIFTEDKGDKKGKVWRFLPKDSVKSVRRNEKGVIEFIELHNGSTLQFDTIRSYMTNPVGAESVPWDFIHIDEPCPEKMFKAHARGLIDSDGSVWFTLTPLTEPWIDDYFFPRNLQKSTDQEVISGRKWAIQGTMHDNPYLTEEAKDEYLSTLTFDERSCRELGIPLEYAGRIYKEFNPSIHVLEKVPHTWKAFNDPPLNYNILVAIDPHPQTPHAVLFTALSPFHQLFVFDEIFEHISTPELARKVMARLEGRHVVFCCADWLAFEENPTTKITMADEFAAEGLFVEKATRDLDRGVLKVQECLKRSDYLHFSPHLPETLWEFEKYIWDQNKPNHPRDKDDHMMENLYRICLEDPSWTDPQRSGGYAIKDEEIVSGARHTKELLERTI